MDKGIIIGLVIILLACTWVWGPFHTTQKKEQPKVIENYTQELDAQDAYYTCPICHSTDIGVDFDKQGNEIWHCNQCHQTFT